jgi:transcriptional regulator NrdR family protein
MELTTREIEIINKMLIKPHKGGKKFNRKNFLKRLKEFLEKEGVKTEKDEIIGRPDEVEYLQILITKKEIKKKGRSGWYLGWGIIIGKGGELKLLNEKIHCEPKEPTKLFIVWGIIPSFFEIPQESKNLEEKIKNFQHSIAKIFNEISPSETLFKREEISVEEDELKQLEEGDFTPFIEKLKKNKHIFEEIKNDLSNWEGKYEEFLENYEKLQRGKKIHVFKIAWSENKWKGMPETKEDYEKSYQIAKSFGWVKEKGIGIEWWNFYEEFDENYFYFTDPTSEGVENIENGDIVLLISTKGGEGRHFVGIMGECEKLTAPKEFGWEKLLNKEQIQWIKEKNPEFPKVGDKEYSISYKVKSRKDLSFCLDKPIPYEPYKEIGDLRIKNYTTIDEKNYDKVIEMLEEAKKENPAQQEKIEKIINKIKNLGKEGIFTHTTPNSNKSLPSIIHAINTKPFLILAGISGTGKTQIARLIAWAMSEENNNKKEG